MKRRFFCLAVLLVLLSSLVGATGVQEAPESKTLVIWSAASEEEADALSAAFKAKNPGIQVEIIRAGSNELLTRLQAEQPNPSGDILLGIAQEAFDAHYDSFVGYKTTHHDEIPDGLKDKGDQPKYYGFSMPLQAFMINTKMLSEADYPKTWKDLTDDKYKGEIILANPALSGSAYSQIYQIYKLYGFDILAKLAKTAVFVASSTTVPESVARGEYAIGVTGEGNIAEHIKNGSPVIALYPEDGTGARFDATGIINGGPNLKSAQVFMEFMTSEEAYQIILDTRSRRVVNPKLPGPGPLPSLSKIKLVPYDAVEAGKIRDELTTKFSDLIR